MKLLKCIKTLFNHTYPHFPPNVLNGQFLHVPYSLPRVNIVHRVGDILSGKSEAEKVLYTSSDFVILPDMKWDLSTLSALYLVAIVRNSTIRSLRDLRRSHLTLLGDIRRQVTRIVQEKWDIGEGGVRMFIHYQPSYCKNAPAMPLGKLIGESFIDHFHVHVTHTSRVGLMGMTIGQCHLLDDVISLVCLDPLSSG